MWYSPNVPEYNLVTLDRYTKTEPILFEERELPAGRVIPVHWHNYIELEILLEGEAEQIINNKSYLMKKGSAYIMTSCDFHIIVPKSNMKILNLSIMRGIIDTKLENCLDGGVGKFLCTFDEGQLSYVSGLFQRAQNESCADPFSALIKKNIAEELIISIIRTSTSNDTESVLPLVQKVIILLNNRFMNQLTLKSVAEELYISPNYLGALFKDKVGVSFNCYVTMIRLRYACGLLDSTNKTVKEIAFDSGFTSNEYFLSVFKKYMKCTPTEYRNNSKADGASANLPPDIFPNTSCRFP